MQRESAPIKEQLIRINSLPQIPAATVYKLRQVLTSVVKWQYKVSFNGVQMSVSDSSSQKASLDRVSIPQASAGISL